MLAYTHVQEVVARAANISTEKLLRGGRLVWYVRPRMVAMLICRDQLGMSYSQIGMAFEHDHSTAHHNVRMARMRIEADRFYREIYSEAMNDLTGETT